MKAPVTSRLRPVVALIVLCAALMSMTACFVLNIFGGGGDGLGWVWGVPHLKILQFL